MILFTYLFEFSGGTYISQFRAKTIEESALMWVNKLKEEQEGIPNLGNKTIAQIQSQIKEEQPTPLQNSVNIWCYSFNLPKGFGLLNIVKTKK